MSLPASVAAAILGASFDEPRSNLRHVLSTADSRDKVTTEQLRLAALVTATIVWSAITEDDVLFENSKSSR